MGNPTPSGETPATAVPISVPRRDPRRTKRGCLATASTTRACPSAAAARLHRRRCRATPRRGDARAGHAMEDTRSRRNLAATAMAHAVLMLLAWHPDLVVLTVALHAATVGMWRTGGTGTGRTRACRRPWRRRVQGGARRLRHGGEGAVRQSQDGRTEPAEDGRRRRDAGR